MRRTDPTGRQLSFEDVRGSGAHTCLPLPSSASRPGSRGSGPAERERPGTLEGDGRTGGSDVLGREK
jgi:hypothetical protein